MLSVRMRTRCEVQQARTPRRTLGIHLPQESPSPEPCDPKPILHPCSLSPGVSVLGRKVHFPRNLNPRYSSTPGLKLSGCGTLGNHVPMAWCSVFQGSGFKVLAFGCRLVVLG